MVRPGPQEVSAPRDTLPPEEQARARPADPRVEALVGTTLAERYRIDRLVAHGATGSVFTAVQNPFGRTVAVKILHNLEEGPRAERFRKRFRREASIASRLSHPNIVTIFDYGETSTGEMFMAMEYLEGSPLHEVLLDDGPLTSRRTLNIGIQLARALRKAHGMGVVHRDLKAANIIVSPDEDDLDFVKVLDFGLVKIFAPEAQLSNEAAHENLTSAGSMMGTPGYMAPEQAIGDPVDGRADIYALGVLLFEMVTGKLPFDADNVVDLITEQVMKPIPRALEVNRKADCPAELQTIIDRCLQKNRDDRYATIEELMAHLKQAWRLENDDSFGTEASWARPNVYEQAPAVESGIEASRVEERASYVQEAGDVHPVRRRIPRWALGSVVVAAFVVGSGLAWWLSRAPFAPADAVPTLIAPPHTLPAGPSEAAEPVEPDPMAEPPAIEAPTEPAARPSAPTDPSYKSNPY